MVLHRNEHFRETQPCPGSIGVENSGVVKASIPSQGFLSGLLSPRDYVPQAEATF
jgi:hypothetical protein